jgi:hypothetical protein
MLTLLSSHTPQEKFGDAIKYYQPVVTEQSEALLGITAMVLANLCVAFIMNSQVCGVWVVVVVKGAGSEGEGVWLTAVWATL